MTGDARLGRDASLWFGAVVRADNTPIVVGDRTNIQDGAMLHSDPGAPLAIGEDCTIGHHAILHGCTLGDRVLVGMGATILNYQLGFVCKTAEQLERLLDQLIAVRRALG